MKKLFKLLVLFCIALLASFPCYAAELTGTFGDANSSDEYRVQVDSDGTVTFASDTSIVYPYKYQSAANTAVTLAATDSGRQLVDAATTYGSKWTLPEAAVGQSFTLSTATAVYVTIDTYDTGDTIKYLTLDAGDSLKSAGAAGDSVTLFCPVASTWVVTQMKGSWSDNGTN